MEQSNLLLGNCLDEMKKLASNSVDAIITDPPYGLKFMGKKWDYDVPSIEIWVEALRVLKPGGHLLSFGGTRTYHRMVINIEDAGFEIRDQIQWLYGTGFPKSHNIGKAIDKTVGAVREIIGQRDVGPDFTGNNFNNDSGARRIQEVTVAASDLAKEWETWGTALKPANEPIVLARKPLEEGLTIAQNIIKWGTGGLNIGECRIQGRERTEYGLKNAKRNNLNTYGTDGTSADFNSTLGRWPANIILNESSAEALNQQMPSAARFFYIAKASKAERDLNSHPTVKPVKLMEYLCKLIAPPNGIILDPFMGSGSTGVAVKNLGFYFIGIEMNEDYFNIAKDRIK